MDGSSADEHLISVGLPVYNGEEYLREAVASILAQTHSNLELIIADNASDDDTPKICESFASQDSRVTYHRHPTNLGAAHNYNFVLERANGEFFKWMAHDDVCKPRFLEACLSALLHDPGVVLAYPSPLDIDSDGNVGEPRDRDLGFDHPDPVERFRRTMRRAHRCLPVFGLTRTELLRATGQHGNYPAADRVLIGELALNGKLVEIEEPLFLHREHPGRFSKAKTTAEEQAEWFDPTRAARRGFSTWRRFAEYLKAVWRSPVSVAQRLQSWVWMARWAVAMRRELWEDLLGRRQ